MHDRFEVENCSLANAGKSPVNLYLKGNANQSSEIYRTHTRKFTVAGAGAVKMVLPLNLGRFFVLSPRPGNPSAPYVRGVNCDWARCFVLLDVSAHFLSIAHEMTWFARYPGHLRACKANGGVTPFVQRVARLVVGGSATGRVRGASMPVRRVAYGIEYKCDAIRRRARRVTMQRN